MALTDFLHHTRCYNCYSISATYQLEAKLLFGVKIYNINIYI